MTEQILEQISGLITPGYFIAAEFSREGVTMPVGLVRFIEEKLAAIHAGSEVRKFVFQEGAWRIILTYFPTDRVVDERYAMKNKEFRRK